MNIDRNKIDMEIFRAIQSIYLSNLIIRTPVKTGFTSRSWTAYQLGNFNYVIVNTNGDVIRFLSEGTKPHFIRPKNKKMLKFRIDKEPTFDGLDADVRKTYLKQFRKNGAIFFFKNRKPYLGYIRQGTRFFCLTVEVLHPGTERNNFLESVLTSKDLEKQFKDKVESILVTAMEKALKK